ncbi:MAG: hypothetical protein ACLQUM_06805 [Steroidobacteraceae bacterium]
MNERLRLLMVCSMLLTGAAAPLHAQSLADQLKQCAAQADDAQRLNCYDRIARPPAPATAGAAAPRSAPATIPPTAAVPSAPAPIPAPGEAAPAAAPNSNAAAFGISNGPLAAKRQTQSLKSISAVVATVTTRPRGELVVTLDNGQVWQQLMAVDYFPLEPGDTVEISSGALGSYVLSAPSKRSTKVTRIR